MKIEVSTDTRVEGSAEVIREVTEFIEAGLSRFRERVTRVEIHLSDINGPRGGRDRRCALEARPASQKPVAVDHTAHTDIEAVRGAVEKITRMLDSQFGRLDDRRGGASASGQPT